jgi:hypothetical protein
MPKQPIAKKPAPLTLDEAVDAGDEATTLKLLAAGQRPTSRTVGKVRPTTTDRVFDALRKAGLDLNDEDGAVTAWVGMWRLSTAERVAYVKRLVAHGLTLDATRLREILESLHPDTAAEDEDGVKLIELAIEEGELESDDALVTCALDTLPLEALERLVAAGAVIPGGARVKSTAPEAAKKKKWLAAREDKPKTTGGKAAKKGAKRIPWAQFARLDGKDLTRSIVCERIVGDRGVFPDAPTDSFESGIEDESLPASHDFYPGDVTEYRVHFWMSGKSGKTDDYKDHGKAMFDALLVALTKALGKPTRGKKDKYWDVEEREISLEQGKYSTQRPYMTVTVRSAARES